MLVLLVFAWGVTNVDGKIIYGPIRDVSANLVSLVQLPSPVTSP